MYTFLMARDTGVGIPVDSDYVAVTDEDGNVIALISLSRKTILYAGSELPFFLVAGPSEQEYPSFYASAILRSATKARSRSK